MRDSLRAGGRAYLPDRPYFCVGISDGSAVTPENPAHPGDRILVRVTGQGQTAPVMPNGMAASGEDPSKPLLPLTAHTGPKPLTVVSALMSASEADVLDVWVEVPELSR